MTCKIGIAKPQYWAVSHEKEHSDAFFVTRLAPLESVI
jgi:hypothetical protein